MRGVPSGAWQSHCLCGSVLHAPQADAKAACTQLPVALTSVEPSRRKWPATRLATPLFQDMPAAFLKPLSLSVQAFQSRVAIGEEARQTMIWANQRLVISMARKFTGRGMDMPDLIAEGMTGLAKGVDRFDHTKGFKFSTYAHWWIRQAISRSLSEQGRMIRWDFMGARGGASDPYYCGASLCCSEGAWEQASGGRWSSA